MRKYLLGLAGAAALAISSGAQAQLTVIDTAANETTVDYDAVVGSGFDYAFGYDDETLANPFMEQLTFDIGSDSALEISLSGVPSSLVFTSVTLSGTLDSGNPFTTVTINPLVPGVNSFLYMTQAMAGVYTLSINGQAPDGGGFGGAVAISAVPEPATWAMLLLGFGAIGFQIRRRRQQVRVQYA